MFNHRRFQGIYAFILFLLNTYATGLYALEAEITDEGNDQCDSIEKVKVNSHLGCPPDSVVGRYRRNQLSNPPLSANQSHLQNSGASPSIGNSIHDCSFNNDQTEINCPNGKTYILNSATFDSTNRDDVEKNPLLERQNENTPRLIGPN